MSTISHLAGHLTLLEEKTAAQLNYGLKVEKNSAMKNMGALSKAKINFFRNLIFLLLSTISFRVAYFEKKELKKTAFSQRSMNFRTLLHSHQLNENWKYRCQKQKYLPKMDSEWIFRNKFLIRLECKLKWPLKGLDNIYLVVDGAKVCIKIG